MSDGPIFTRTARGYWGVKCTFEDALALQRQIAGDRRSKYECWKLAEGAWLYVGPRPRRRATRHVAHLLTEAGATLLGMEIPARVRHTLEAQS